MSRGDRPFLWALAILGGGYLVLILAMVGANFLFINREGLSGLATPEIRFAIWFSQADTLTRWAHFSGANWAAGRNCSSRLRCAGFNINGAGGVLPD